MRTGWLDTDMHPAAAWALVALIGYMTIVSPIYRRWRWHRIAPADLPRLYRLLHLQRLSHLAIFAALLAFVPGVTPANLGLSLPTQRSWQAAVAITALALFIAVVWLLKHRAQHIYHGQYHETTKAARQEAIRDVLVGCTRDTFLFIVLPPLVAVGAFGLPPGWVAVAMVLGYGFVHLPNGAAAIGGWTLVAAVAVTVYLMSMSALLPGLLITAVGVAWIYAHPLPPPPPRPPPPLTVTEGPAPLR